MLATLIAATFSREERLKMLTIPYLVDKKRRMASVLVLFKSATQEKAIMVHLECELATTSARRYGAE